MIGKKHSKNSGRGSGYGNTGSLNNSYTTEPQQGFHDNNLMQQVPDLIDDTNCYIPNPDGYADNPTGYLSDNSMPAQTPMQPMPEADNYFYENAQSNYGVEDNQSYVDDYDSLFRTPTDISIVDCNEQHLERNKYNVIRIILYIDGECFEYINGVSTSGRENFEILRRSVDTGANNLDSSVDANLFYFSIVSLWNNLINKQVDKVKIVW